jgi:group I intron endonuclease
MLLLEIITLVRTIPLASTYLSTILIHRIAALILLSSCAILGPVIYGRLFQLTILFQSSSLFILSGFSFIEELNILLTPSFQDGVLAAVVIIYTNAETDKSQILSDNKGKAGIYQWTHKKSGKIYIGSAVDLSLRLKGYFSITYLNKAKSNSYIYNAILEHGYSAFSLSILEYIDISNLSKEEIRKVILSKEQFYLDESLTRDDSTYNILKIAGSSLGYKHSPEALVKISLPKSEEAKLNMSKPRSEEAKLNMRKPRSEKAKLNMRKPRSMEHKTRISEAHKKLGKVTSPETKAKMSATRGTAIFVYDSNGSLVYTFTSATLAGKFFKCSKTTILNYANNGKLFKGQQILSLSAKE